MNFTPIALFVYNRPEHTLKTLNALKANKYSEESILYIYSDGFKENSSFEEKSRIEQVRTVIKKEQWCKEVMITEQPKNLGLAKSIILGVTEIVNKHGTVIVLEDDIVTSTGFLKFMNESLLFYEKNHKIMHISGYMYPHNEDLEETFFFNVPLCWGWATWKRAWNNFNNDSIFLWKEINRKGLINDLDKFGANHLSRQLAFNITGRLNTWFIKWHASVLLKGGFTLFPNKSLVDNIGFDNSGVHNGTVKEFKNKELISSINIGVAEICENRKAENIIKKVYLELEKNAGVSRKITLKKKIKKRIRKMFFKLFPEIKAINKIDNDVVLIRSYVGKNVKIYPKAKLNNSIVGNYTYLAQNAIINNTIIGKFCSIGPNLISGWGIHPIHGISTHPMFYSNKKQNGLSLSKSNKISETLPIEIGNDVFIGMNVSILDGVKIGNGAVIGAGAVVSKNIPDYAIAVGNPIRIIKYRFEDDIIKVLQEKKWWDREDNELNLIEEHFFDVENYIKILTSS